MSTAHFVGQPFKRKEDKRLYSGRGKYIADIKLPKMAHVAFVRSQVAHARIKAVDISRAQSLPGVIAVYLARDLAAHLAPLPGLQQRPPSAWSRRVEHTIGIPDQPLIADTKVRHVGEPFAIVIAETRYIAEDAIELIEF